MSGRRAFGSIRKARSGRFEVRYTGPDGGKYTAGRSFVRKTDASAFLAHVEAEISEGTWTSPKESRERERAQELAAERAAMTFAAWSERWLASLERLGRTPQTIQTHTYRMRHLVPTFGAKPLGAISVDDVDTWYQSVWQAKGPGVVRPLYMTLSTCMNAAVKSGLIEASPCKVPEGQKHRPVRERERQVATPEEVRAAADAMPARLRIAVLLAAWCQTRLGELTGLQRRDLDLDSMPATLRIERQVQYLAGEGPVELPRRAPPASVRSSSPHRWSRRCAHTSIPMSRLRAQPGSYPPSAHLASPCTLIACAEPGSAPARMRASPGLNSTTCGTQASRSSHSKARRLPSCFTVAGTATSMSRCVISTRPASATLLWRHVWTRMSSPDTVL